MREQRPRAGPDLRDIGPLRLRHAPHEPGEEAAAGSDARGQRGAANTNGRRDAAARQQQHRRPDRDQAERDDDIGTHGTASAAATRGSRSGSGFGVRGSFGVLGSGFWVLWFWFWVLRFWFWFWVLR